MHWIKKQLSLIATLICVTAESYAAEPLAVHGSTTFVSRLMEPHKLEIERRAGIPLTVMANKSINGLLALIEGRAELAMISAPLETELVLLRRHYPNAAYDRLQGFEVTRTAVAFVVHPSNPISTLKLDDIRRILNGQAINWRDFGGQDLSIKPVFVREGGGVTLTVQSHLMAGQLIAAPMAVRIDTPRQVLKVVAQEPGAFGITQPLLARQAGLPLLKTDGLVEQTLNLVTLGPPSERAMRVINATRAVAAERLF
jgi:phosphate transport system substrate-binding protein